MINAKKTLTFFCLILASIQLLAARVESIKISSVFLGKESPVNVVLPDVYDDSDSLPVLYLLHGHGGDCASYILSDMNLLSNVDLYKIIVVCVNGEASWYINSPVVKESAYDSYISDELFPYIAKHYSMSSKRGVAGLSMGGFGSLSLALRHPSLFAYVGSTSGGVDILPFPKNWGLPVILGEQSTHIEQWKMYSPYYMLDNVDVQTLKFKLVLDCGSEDFFFAANNLFDQKLRKLGVKHEYFVSAGAHNWLYWNKTISVHINKFCEAVK